MVHTLLQLVKTFEQLWSFLSHTLLYVQQDHSYLKDCCHQAVAELAALGYITLEAGAHPDDSSYSITVLGQATYRGQSVGRQIQKSVYDESCKGQGST